MTRLSTTLALAATALFAPGLQAVACDAPLDGKRIEQLTGVKGALDQQSGVFKVNYPRKDLNVRATGVAITPPLGLTAWAAFKQTCPKTMVMGDMVLTADQVNPVMSVALENGLEVTALHNHFFWESPQVWFMHIGGTGDEAKLATAVGKVFDKLKATQGGKGQVPRANIDPAKTTLDPKRIEQVLGTKGEMNQGVYKVTIGRKTEVDGHVMGKAMGVNTWAAFAGSNDQAVVDGDFAVLEDELQGVLKALRQHDINVVAIHNHMTHEKPRLIFLHYWGIGSVSHLATGVKAALNLTKPGVQGE
jgi:hypothetical protein